ncbi:hypothetical protein DFH06DRAFT_1121469 [Mycena polygramma]|nr:hypothetical protein DFH06DRAFT_1121469 [Mycena polygramma]
MPLPPSVLLQAPSKALYDAAWAEKQRADQDLIVYCPSFLLGLPCRIAWPTVNGHRVPAIHIREFLIANGLHWSCFCPMSDPATRETSASCRIITWPDLGTFAVCHHSLPRCQFFIDLVQVYHMSTLRQLYQPVSKTDSSMARFLLSPEAPSSIGQPIYLPGYLGEAEGGTQLGGIMEGNSDTFLASYCDYIQPSPSGQHIRDTSGPHGSGDGNSLLSGPGFWHRRRNGAHHGGSLQEMRAILPSPPS